MHVPSLHTAPKENRFLFGKCIFARRFQGLKRNQFTFFLIFKSNKASYQFLTDQLKITFKHPNFVCESF